MSTGQPAAYHFGTKSTSEPRRQCMIMSRYYLLCVLAIAGTSFFLPSKCGAETKDLRYSDQLPTLKEIFGGVPPNSLPLMRQDARTSQFSNAERRRALPSDKDSGFEEADSEEISQSPRRRLTQQTSQLIRRRLTKTFSPSLNEITAQVNAADTGDEYYVKMQIGTPVQDVLLIMDTGSFVTWVQSKQCTVCYPELLPTYDSTLSSTFKPVITNGSETPFQLGYVDGSGSFGIQATDTLTIDSGSGNSVVLPGFEFGLAINNIGDNSLFSGILGLGASPQLSEGIPLLLQLETLSNGSYSKFSKKFRYCFPDRYTHPDATSFLSFGDATDSNIDSLFSWTPILNVTDYINYTISAYFLNLTAISVAGTRINIDPSELTIEAVVINNTNTVLDSGTTLLELREPYFSKVIDAYGSATVNLGPWFSSDWGGLAYNMSKDVFDASVFPGISFIFQKWQPKGGNTCEEIEVFVPKNNLFEVDSDDADGSSTDTSLIYLLNIANSSAGGSLQNFFGNYMQENFLIEYDLEELRVGFLPASCASE